MTASKNKNQFTFKSKLWLYPGPTPWHFLSLPKKESQELMKLFHGMTAGFGSLPVSVTIGKMKWKTSIFPDRKNGEYMLPIKKEIRTKEDITDGDIVNYTLTILM